MATIEANFSLGHTRILAESIIKHLYAEQWIGRNTVALKVHFTLYSPAPKVFSSVTFNIKRSPFGVLEPSATVQPVTVFPLVSEWDYVVVACKILFLILLFLRLSHQIVVICEKGLIRYCKLPCNWLEVSLSVVAIVFYIYGTYRTVLVSDIKELLKRHNYKTHIDLSSIATCDQSIRSLSGTLLLLLTLRCVSLVNRTAFSTHSVCCIFGILLAGLISVAALSCMGDYFHLQSSKVKQRAKRLNSPRNIFYHEVTFVLTRLVWTTLVIMVVSLSAKRVWRKKDLFTTDLVQYFKNKLFLGWTRSAHNDSNMERKTYYFEQLDSVLDELLIKLDAISDKTLPSEVYKQDSPISPTQDKSKIDTKDYPETKVTQPLALFHSDISGPVEISYPLSNDQKGNKISNEFMPLNKPHEDESRSDKTTEESGVEISQPLSVEMVVEVLIHKEQDRDLQHNVEGNNFLN